MLSTEENELMTQVSAGTPMGTLLRYYWHPVCAADELLQSPFRTKEVKLLGEEGGEPSINVFHNREDNDALEYPAVPQEGGLYLRRSALFQRGGAAPSFRYVPSESGYSRDADKIEAAMATWQSVDTETQRALSFPN